MSSRSATDDREGQEASAPSVEQFLQHGLYRRNWSRRTVRAYRYALHEVPSTMTKSAIDGWITRYRQQQHAPGGINVRMRALNSYLSWLRANVFVLLTGAVLVRWHRWRR